MKRWNSSKGESQGFERDKVRPNAWRYRDWVVQALNRDLPYDEFARLQLAGDVLFPDDADAVTATGFLVAGPYDEVGQQQQSAAMKAVVRQDEMEDIIGTRRRMQFVTRGKPGLAFVVTAHRVIVREQNQWDWQGMDWPGKLTITVNAIHRDPVARDRNDSIADRGIGFRQAPEKAAGRLRDGRQNQERSLRRQILKLLQDRLGYFGFGLVRAGVAADAEGHAPGGDPGTGAVQGPHRIDAGWRELSGDRQRELFMEVDRKRVVPPEDAKDVWLRLSDRISSHDS